MDADIALRRGEGLMEARRLITERFRRFPRTWLLKAFLSGCVALSVSVSIAFGADSSNMRGASKTAFQIEVQDANGAHVAGPSAAPSKKGAVVLEFDREYQPGDRLLFDGPSRMAVQVDETLPECLVYVPASSQSAFTYEIPYGREEKQTGSAYAPESFGGKSHHVSARKLTPQELKGYRNLALNPCDLPRAEGASIQFFPHASSNSVSRSLYDFEARNAIDGATKNGHHGVWPYESWGPQLRTDIWWKVDFGRPVELDKVRLMVRADFPHDSYWKSADIEFSDGSKVPLQITSSADFQEFSFSKRKVSWMRIINVVPADPARWCAFIEVEAWGHDLR